jgi:hypothetical protein
MYSQDPRTLTKNKKGSIVESAPSDEWKLVEWTRCSPLNAGTSNTFEVYELRDKSYVYLKPVRPYPNCEFELLFGFGFGCSGFDENRIIRI